MKSVFSLALLSVLVLFSACSKSDPDAKAVPSDLTLEAVVKADGTGLVNFTATAKNASKFTFDYDEAGVADESNFSGNISHTYAETGSYDVKMTATSRDGISSDITKTINVTVNGPSIPTGGYSTPDHYDGMTLVWQDEFNGTSLNTADWNYETGGSGWGNNELEYYQAANTTVADGYLVIEARKEAVGGRNYTSSRLTTANKKFFKYGRVDIRAALPKGQGIWPALWMLGSSIGSGVNWPACGEIDIMEMIGGGAGRDNQTYGTSHWDDGGHQQQGGSTTLSGSAIFADDFHVFSIIWTDQSIQYLRDDVLFNTTPITQAARSEFRENFFFIMNVAVGGNWPGDPNASTIFPQHMAVDYIRVFQ